jgi:LPXTG-motif cell wall-anchored protein
MKKIIASLFLVLGVGALSAGSAAASRDDEHEHKKVTICHAAGQEGTDKYLTLTISEHAVYKDRGGHFYENGTPRAGHENDYFGECKVQETTTTSTTVPPTTSVVTTTIPETSVPETSAPGTTLPETSAPETTVPSTTFPETTVPETTVPTATTVEVGTPPTTTLPPKGSLPKTGSGEFWILLFGLLSVLGGIALVLFPRK